MTTTNGAKALSSLLSGQTCRSAIGGAGAGSVITLGFGESIERPKPLSNQLLTEFERQYEQEINLVVFCAWRLAKHDSVTFSWRDTPSSGLTDCLGNLCGHTVQQAHVDCVSFDMKLEFSGELVLHIFCDVTNNSESDENYYISDRGSIHSVGICSIYQGAESKS